MKLRILMITTLLLFGCAEKITPLDPNSKFAGYGSGGNPDGWGDHTGEVQFLDVDISYLNSFGKNEDGLEVFYLGQPMTVQVSVSNTGNRRFEHIDLRMTLEYKSDGGCFISETLSDGSCSPTTTWVDFKEGDQLPGNTQITWADFNIDPGQNVTFTHTYTVSCETCPGYDRVHIEMRHTNDGPWHAAKFYDNPKESFYCPPAL